MKKRNTFLAGLLTLMFSASAVAQDLVIPTIRKVVSKL